VLLTTNLPFSEWTQVIPNARLCKALLDRITDRAHIIETGSDSYRFRRTLELRGRHGRSKTTNGAIPNPPPSTEKGSPPGPPVPKRDNYDRWRLRRRSISHRTQGGITHSTRLTRGAYPSIEVGHSALSKPPTREHSSPGRGADLRRRRARGFPSTVSTSHFLRSMCVRTLATGSARRLRQGGQRIQACLTASKRYASLYPLDSYARRE
jgi:hypothetical protein